MNALVQKTYYTRFWLKLENYTQKTQKNVWWSQKNLRGLILEIVDMSHPNILVPLIQNLECYIPFVLYLRKILL